MQISAKLRESMYLADPEDVKSGLVKRKGPGLYGGLLLVRVFAFLFLYRADWV